MTNRRVQWMSESELSKHAGALRLSLLVALGLAPIACGGTATKTTDAQAGASGTGGAVNRGGAPSGGGGAASVGGSVGATSGGGADGGAPHCESPVFDPTTGIVSCANGFSHHSTSVACSAGPAGSAGTAGAAGAAGVPETCTQDSDCAALPFGFCFASYYPLGVPQPKTCASACQQDSDCGTGFCDCDSTGHNLCVGGCRTDADCGPNSMCASVYQVCGGQTFECFSANDECHVNTDCGGGISACTFNDGKRACESAECGRPFLVDESARLAPLAAHGDWLNTRIAPASSDLSSTERAALCAHWARLGQMEHASIAAFARFNMQLLALGAPGELIEACNRATADETVHTRLCFALASAYAGAPIGPGKLEVTGSLDEINMAAIMKLVIREGCVGETVASLQALEAAALATDPAVKTVLSRIAQDEQQHAELAFKFMSWALGECPAEACAELALEAAQSLADLERRLEAQSNMSQTELPAHGMLSSRQLRATHLAAVNHVVRPLLATLFDVQRLRHCAGPLDEALGAQATPVFASLRRHA